MTLSLEHLVGQRLLWSFNGKAEPPAEFTSALKRGQVGGVNLFRALNIDRPDQVRRLIDQLQATAREAGLPVLLITADQEGGQLIGLGDQTTPFPGNMALGATRSIDLAQRVGYAIGREAAALGVNVNFAPVCDVNINPNNPVIGTRSFGESPELVSSLAAAMITGLQAAGVAATAKHFPGHGDTASDSHYGTPLITHSQERLRRVEFPPFRAAIEADVKLIMTAHIAVSTFDQDSNLPATLSKKILSDVLRRELNFNGVITTDAMDMQAVMPNGYSDIATVSVAAAAAGSDLLLLTSFIDQVSIYAALLKAVQAGQIDRSDFQRSIERIAALKNWIAAQPARPSLEVVGSAEHQQLANEVAERSITLVRDEAQRLPLKLSDDDRVAVILPQPQNLTPADTSSYVVPALARRLRKRHAKTDQFIIPLDPSEADVAALVQTARHYNLIIVGTINAGEHAGQAALIKHLIEQNIATIAVALRLPYDLQAYPNAPTFVCTYSVLNSSMEALAKALLGEIPFSGKLPVSIGTQHPIGYGLNSTGEKV
jgi:beta-N-acetylhexosaminidase